MTQQNSQRWYFARERRCLWYWLLFFIQCCFCDVGCCCSFIAVFVMLVAVLHSLFFIAIAGFLHPFYTFSWAHRSVISNTFVLTFPGPSFTFLPRALRFWVAIFYSQVFFALRSFPTFLPQPAFISRASLGVGSSFFEFVGLHADPPNIHPAHLFVWFTAICNLDIQKNSYLNRTKYYHKLLVVKSLVICSLFVSNSFCLFKVVFKDYKNPLNKTCTGYNRFDETAHQSYF